MDESDSRTKTWGSQRIFNLLHRLPTSDRLLLHFLLAAVVASAIWVLLSINDHFSSTVSITGGTIIEGVLGTPRYINPVLASSRADRDMTALLYDGVLTLNEHGELQPHLATAISKSDDGRTYTIDLRDDITFHDGTPLTAADVVFTYNLIKDPDLKSPLRGAWSNTTVTLVNDHRLEIVLAEPYAPFIENLKVGIMPYHIWSGIGALEMPFHNNNIEPVGSGPYRIGQIDRSRNGTLQGYELRAHNNSVNSSYVDSIYIQFFASEHELRTALLNGSITSTAHISTHYLQQFESDSYELTKTPLPRVFGVFFNQNRNPALRSQPVRQALSMSIDRERIVADATNGYYIPTHSPIPNLHNTIESTDVSDQSLYRSDLESATNLLLSDGWERNDDGLWEKEINDEPTLLSITLRTSQEAPYDSVVELVRSDWEELGVEVRVELFEESDLVEGIVAPREFEAVMFGIDLGRGLDLYPFWHSSQQSAPGLNIAQFASISTDQRLQTLRVSDDAEARETALSEIVETIREEVPALFLFTPTTNYIRSAQVKTERTPTLFTESSDRLRFITSWHTLSYELWPLFHSRTEVIKETNE